MRPIALLQHDKTQRPGYLLQFLADIGVEARVFQPEAGDGVPRRARDFSGIALLGSNRSVNDPLPWIGDEIALVRDAMSSDVPVLGHCFGGQLMAKALGAPVGRAARPNIGWTRLHATTAGQDVLEAQEVLAFNWHYETFGIPRGARRLLYGTHCLNKAFAFGPHLAFQCHFEVTADILRDWCAEGKTEIELAKGPGVQGSEIILSLMPDCLPQLHATARRIYRAWTAQLTRPPLVTVSSYA